MPEQPISIWGLESNQMLILAAIVGLAVGYILFTLINKRQKTAAGSEASLEKDRATSNVAFMKGINYILSDKQDRAIEELIRAVAVDTETVETYIALGNLFRSKGEIDRAIRIRQSIILRPNLAEKIRIQALFDLGLDYQRGGFYERAIRTFEEVIASAPPAPGGLFSARADIRGDQGLGKRLSDQAETVKDDRRKSGPHSGPLPGGAGQGPFRKRPAVPGQVRV